MSTQAIADRINALPALRETVQKHGLMADKSLGQHFIFDLNITDRIARAASLHLSPGSTLVEVGPGPGGLTRSILKYLPGTLLVVEKDSRFLPVLQELTSLSDNKMHIIQGDALKVHLADTAPPPYYVVANLPYNVSTPLLFGWLEQHHLFDGFTLMFQKEVAERIMAEPDTEHYGRLAVMAQWRCTIKQEFDVPPSVFVPPPKVMSSVISLKIRPTPLAPAPEAALAAVCKAAFGQRRKMLRASLKQLCDNPTALLESANISPEARPETLSVEQFCALARAYEHIDK